MDVMALGSKSTLAVRNEENLCLGNVPLISIHSMETFEGFLV